MELIKRIAKFRDERGWSNNRMALEADVSAATVANWFKRKVTPQHEAIVSLCEAFGVTLAEFFNDEPERLSLSVFEKELLSEMSLMSNDERGAVLNLVKTINAEKKKPRNAVK